jgi:hypothetical protein
MIAARRGSVRRPATTTRLGQETGHNHAETGHNHGAKVFFCWMIAGLCIGCDSVLVAALLASQQWHPA